MTTRTKDVLRKVYDYLEELIQDNLVDDTQRASDLPGENVHVNLSQTVNATETQMSEKLTKGIK